MGYPPYKTVYHHYRSWSARGNLRHRRREACQGYKASYSGRKGIKRHIAVDRNGYPLGMDITTANVHDSRGADRLISCVLSDYRQITVIKADMGYRGAFKDMPLEELGISLECVRSNYGTSGFVPVAGRWVVERTISWLQTYRRLMRNYEKYLRTAGHMTLLAMIFFMLRYFA